MTIRGPDDGFASLHRVLRGSDLRSARAIGRLEGSGARQSANSPLHRVLGPFTPPQPPNLDHTAGDFWPISLSRALPYAAVGLRKADRATRDAFNATARETPVCARCGGQISCVGLRRAG